MNESKILLLTTMPQAVESHSKKYPTSPAARVIYHQNCRLFAANRFEKKLLIDMIDFLQVDKLPVAVHSQEGDIAVFGKTLFYKSNAANQG